MQALFCRRFTFSNGVDVNAPLGGFAALPEAKINHSQENRSQRSAISDDTPLDNGPDSSGPNVRPSVAIVTPILNETTTLEALAHSFTALDPAPTEITIVDGGSTDGSVDMARALGFRVIIATHPGRPGQINEGVAASTADYICVVHADTHLPTDALSVVQKALADPRVSLASFTPLIGDGAKTRWATTLHNWLKTWYVPLFFRPHLFVRGGRLLFGDHAMFFRRDDFLAVEGFDPTVTVMEEADLCLKLARRGRIRLMPRFVRTSDRRLAHWGELKANWVFFKVGLQWAFGKKRGLEEQYPDVR